MNRFIGLLSLRGSPLQCFNGIIAVWELKIWRGQWSASRVPGLFQDVYNYSELRERVLLAVSSEYQFLVQGRTGHRPPSSNG